MAENYGTSEYATKEQLVYADLLDLGMKIGLGALVLAFLLYVSGILPGHVPLEQINQYWSMKVHDYQVAAGVPVGWGWVSLAGKGDFLNFVPIAFLAAVTIGCYLRILPMLHRAGDKVYTAIAVLEVLVLVLAASGILVGGH